MNPIALPTPSSDSGSIALLLFIAMGVITLGSFLFWIWMLVDCIRHETDEGERRLWWALGIGFFHFLGATVYLFFRKLPRKRHATS